MKPHPLKGKKQSPEHIAKRTGPRDQKTKDKISKSLKGHGVSKKTREKISKAIKKTMKNKDGFWKGKKFDETHRKNMSKAKKGKPLSETTKVNISKAKRGKKQHQEHITKRVQSRICNGNYQRKCGEENSNWKGGISAEPYCEVWLDNNFKESIKERDNFKCQNPTCKQNCNRLSIHHINYIKKDCRPKNLITLCISCNSRANYNRKEWEKLYTKIMKEKLKPKFKFRKEWM